MARPPRRDQAESRWLRLGAVSIALALLLCLSGAGLAVALTASAGGSSPAPATTTAGTPTTTAATTTALPPYSYPPAPAPGPTPCPRPQITLAVSPLSSPPDQPLTLYGRVLSVHLVRRTRGTPSGGRTTVLTRRLVPCGYARVLLRQAPAGLGYSLPGGRTVSGPHGRFSLTLPAGRVKVNSLWRAYADRAVSPLVPSFTQALLTLSSTATFAVAGDVEVLSGQVIPAHPGQRVLLQKLTASGWTTLAAARLNSASAYRRPLHLTDAGVQSWRAVLAGDLRNLTSYSSGVTIKVAPLTGIHKIRHVVVIMQENRSFDTYFGTYPGAEGIPPGVCLPDPVHGGCVAPYHDPYDLNYGGPHGATDAVADIDGGKMDGFVAEAEKGFGCNTTDPSCSPCNASSSVQASEGRCSDVMGYHDAREIPNYWAYAHNYVLQDHMFQSDASWSLPAHLYMVSEWSASCRNPYDPFSCRNNIGWPTPDWVTGNTGNINGPSDQKPKYAWTDMTYLLHHQNVPWAYYISQGSEPDCEDDNATSCPSIEQAPTTPGIWNPLPDFTDVRQDGQLGNIKALGNFYGAARQGTLPAVSWIDPNGTQSEHPPALVSTGQSYVTGLINAIMQGPDWDSTAIFLSWDDWGGFYDNVVPPSVDSQGYGMRVPGLVISPYAKRGYIDHQVLSFDAFNRFIEDDFLDGQRLDPTTDGRPDPRPDVRDAQPLLGDLQRDFNFNQLPQPPLILSQNPQPGPASQAP
jgi:phospholipase C